MYGAIREYRVQPGTADEVIAKIHAEFVPMIANVRGLVAYTVAVAAGNGIITTSIFENQAGAQESVKRAAGWVQDTLKAFTLGATRVTIGDITVRHVKDEVKAGYGVMRRFACTSANAVQISSRVRESLVPILDATPGFASFGLLIQSGTDCGGASLSGYADRATAETANAKSLAWIKENVGNLLTKPPEVVVGEIKLRYTRSTDSVL
jgi:hypothetical protein